jgi:hypothetical protein
MNKPVRRLASANPQPPDFQPGRFHPFRVGGDDQRRSNEHRTKSGEKLSAAQVLQIHHNHVRNKNCARSLLTLISTLRE